MTTISKKIGILINYSWKKYNDTYHKTLKMKPADINPRMYMDFNKKR